MWLMHRKEVSKVTGHAQQNFCEKCIPSTIRMQVTQATQGRDWQGLEAHTCGRVQPAQGLTMVGLRRLDNLEMLAEKLQSEGVPGDFIECGVWRGGASIFMRGLLKAHDVHDRAVHLVDSFDGENPCCMTPLDAQMWHNTFIEALLCPAPPLRGSTGVPTGCTHGSAKLCLNWCDIMNGIRMLHQLACLHSTPLGMHAPLCHPPTAHLLSRT